MANEADRKTAILKLADAVERLSMLCAKTPQDNPRAEEVRKLIAEVRTLLADR